MAKTEIWEDANGLRVEVTADWPGVPLLVGPTELVTVAQDALESMRRPREEWTIPRLDEEFERGLADRGLAKVAYKTDFSLAEAHLKAAVRHAETSTQEYRKVLEGYVDLQKELSDRRDSGDSGPIDFLKTMMWTVHLDRTLEASRSAVILAASSAEAFINERAIGAPAWNNNLDRAQLPTKWLLVPQLVAGKTFDTGRMPYQSLVELNKLRNKLVHGRPDLRVVEISESSDAEAYMAATYARPEWDVKPDSGRWACSVVRDMCLAYCEIVGDEPQRFLAYVPPGGKDDIHAWVTASIMTGARDDPDFPSRPAPFWE